MKRKKDIKFLKDKFSIRRVIMNIKEKLLKFTWYSIKFKLVIAVVIVQCFSSSIGQTVNLAIWQGRKALQRIGIATDYFDGTIGVFVSAAISIIISLKTQIHHIKKIRKHLFS